MISNREMLPFKPNSCFPCLPSSSVFTTSLQHSCEGPGGLSAPPPPSVGAKPRLGGCAHLPQVTHMARLSSPWKPCWGTREPDPAVWSGSPVPASTVMSPHSPCSPGCLRSADSEQARSKTLLWGKEMPLVKLLKGGRAFWLVWEGCGGLFQSNHFVSLPFSFLSRWEHLSPVSLYGAIL